AAFNRRATLDQGPALRRHCREAVAAGVAMQRVQRERRLAAPDPFVARQQTGAHACGGALALREGELALGRDLLAFSRQRLARRRARARRPPAPRRASIARERARRGPHRSPSRPDHSPVAPTTLQVPGAPLLLLAILYRG